MADITKTVSIIFEGDTSDATRKVEALGKQLDEVDSGDAKGKLTGVGEAINKVGKEAGTAGTAAGTFADKMKQVAVDAGAPTAAIDGITNALTRIGAPSIGAAALAGAGVAAFLLTLSYGNAVMRDFKVLNDNLNGSVGSSEAAWKSLTGIVGRLETDLAQTGDAYARFMAKISDTGLNASVARAAFEGIVKAIEATGGGMKEAEKALDKFAQATKDGSVDLKGLESITSAIPGSMRIFAESLGVTKDELKLLAKEGELGTVELEKFAEALKNQNYTSLKPISDAFTDLKNQIVLTAESLGADGALGLATYAFEKAIRAVTLTIVTGGESLAAFGKTIANVLALLSGNQTAGDFAKNQVEIFDQLTARVGGAYDKLVGYNKELGSESSQTAGKNYKELAESIKAQGDAADGADDKVKKLSNSLTGAERVQIELAKATVAADKVLAMQAETVRKAEADVAKFRVEMEKIASNERIKNLELKINLNIAQLQADTERIKATFTSIDNTVKSTGDLLGDLFGLFKNYDQLSFAAIRTIETQIELENKRRQEALNLQKRLTDAQIEQMKARTRALDRSDALIKVDGAGLQPHLEAFMWEILRTIQVKVNQDGLEMLLGI